MQKRLLAITSLLLFYIPLFAKDVKAKPSPTVIFSLTLLALFVIIGVFALIWIYRYQYKGHKNFFAYAFEYRLVKFSLVMSGVVLIVSFVNYNPWGDDPYDMVEYAKLRKMPQLASENYKILTERYPTNIEYCYNYVTAFYRKDAWEKDGEVDLILDRDNSPFYFFRKININNSGYMGDIGLLGVGMSEFYEGMFLAALSNLDRMENKDIPYANFMRGKIALKTNKLDESIEYFNKEIALGYAIKESVTELSLIYYHLYRDNFEELREFCDNEQFKTYIPPYLIRYKLTKEGAMLPYLGHLISYWYRNTNFIGFLGGLMGLFVWFSFLRNIDIFKKQKIWPMIATVAAGGVFAFLVFPISSFINYEIGFQKNGEPGNDFLYCFIAIGMVEEFVKILPLLFLLSLTDIVRTPIDYIIYASLSALGFSFIENLEYFDTGSITSIHMRTLVCNTGHMFDTATVAFGLVLAKYRFGKYKVPLFILFFILGAFSHGFYDFWIINEKVVMFSLLSYATVIFMSLQYSSYINNSLNNSPIFRNRKILDTHDIAVKTLTGLLMVYLFEYIAISLAYGSWMGNYILVDSLGTNGFLIFFIILNLNNIDIVHGEWFWIRLWNLSSWGNYSRILGQRLRLLPGPDSKLLKSVLPAYGEVIARINLKDNNRYFLFAFDQGLAFGPHNLEYVLIKAKDADEVIEKGHRMEVAFIIFRDKEALVRRKKRKNDFKILEYVLVE